ncbi:MAG TPA: histidine phosphatase family protein [Acidimicrobiales bacterium]|nr:histidine phosphatase family protein [Acidimicrobiales bacterium]
MIVLVRHGQTAANASRLLLGRADPPLTELGLRQARAAAGVVDRAALIVSSPLGRARQTAEVIAGEGPVVVDDRWIELDYGEYDGRPLDQVPTEIWDRWRTDASYCPPGGESLATLGERVRDACTELLDRAGDQDVVVVSHVSPIKAAVAWAIGSGDEVAWRMFLGVASITRIRVGGRHPSLVAFNDCHHLDGLT